MNKRRYNIILIFSLVLFLSIGYAVVNSVSLTITGSATAGSEILEVYFTGTTEVSDYSKAVATASGTSATATVSNMTLNETVTLEYQIKNNESDVDAELVVTIPDSNDYFDVSISQGSISGDPTASGHPVPQSNELIIEYDVVYLADSSTGGHVGSTTSQTYTIGAGETFVLMLSVKMIKTPIDTYNSSFDFNINITANPVSSSL